MISHCWLHDRKGIWLVKSSCTNNPKKNLLREIYGGPISNLEQSLENCPVKQKPKLP